MARRRRRSGVPHKAPAATRLKHDWISYEEYRHIHRSSLEHHPFVIEDLTAFIVVGDALRPDQVELAGEIICARDVRVALRKLLETRVGRNRRLEVRTYGYRYHAYRLDQELVRYDNSHNWTGIHRHEFDPRTGEELRVVAVAREEMPTLYEFLTEVASVSEGC
jgi:hypothetical protein